MKRAVDEVKQTLLEMTNCKLDYMLTTTMSPKSLADISRTEAAEPHFTNEILVQTPVDTTDDVNDIYIAGENEIENHVFDSSANSRTVMNDKVLSIYSENTLQDSDQENDIEIETFSGQKEDLSVNDIDSDLRLNTEPQEKSGLSYDDIHEEHINRTSSTHEESANDIALNTSTSDVTVEEVNTVPDGNQAGKDMTKLNNETDQEIFKDCSDVSTQTSGIYIISPSGTNFSFHVYCQFDDNDYWLVFQRRLDGTVDFYRNWDDYKNGFGQIEGEFWLGNEKLHLITTHNKYMLRIDMWDWNVGGVGEGLGNHFYAESNYFYVDNESEFYRMHVPNGFYDYSGFGGSGLRVHAGPFMAYDKHPSDMRTNCAQLFHTGWWFKTCVRNANLNGKYYNGGYAVPENRTRAQDGIFWRNIPRSLKKVEMKLKRVL